MLNVFRCPNCEKKLRTDQAEGQSIPCPYCKEVFTISAEDAVVPDPERERLMRLAIPLGYVLFVAVPLVLTVLFLTRRAERQERNAAEAAQAARVETKEPAPRPPAPKPKRKEKGPNVPDGPAPDPDPVPAGPTAPEPKAELAVAPEPRAVPAPVEVFVAPEPHAVFWNLPTLYESPWQKVGDVYLRISRVSVGRVPVIDGKEQVRDTAQPMLVVVVEVRTLAAEKKRELSSWTDRRLHHSAAFLGAKELPHPDIPLGSRVHSGVPAKQPLPADGEPVRDVLVFVAPPDGAGDVSVRLDAERCGETGDIWFNIPAAALKK